MSKSTVTVIMAGTAVLASVILIRQVLLQVRRRRWDTSATFILLIACVVNLRPALAGFLHAFTVQTDIFNERILIYSSSLNRLVKYGDRLLVAGAVILVIRGLGHRYPIPPAALAGLCLLGLECVASETRGDGFAGNPQLLLGVLLLASAFMRPGIGACLGAATFGVVMATASGVLSLVNYNAAVQACTTKCGPLGVLYPGATENENALGLILVLALPFVYLAFEGRLRAALAAYVVFMTFMTGSRTSQIAAVVTTALLIVIRPTLEARREGRKTRSIVSSSIAITCVVGLATPFVISNPHSLTERGYIWAVARHAWGGARWIGNGTKAWSSLVDTGVISPVAVYSAHNQWLDTLFVAGICGLGVFVAFLVLLLRSPERGHRTAIALIVLPALVAGVAERPWSFGGLDWLSWALLATILAAPSNTLRDGTARSDAVSVQPVPARGFMPAR